MSEHLVIGPYHIVAEYWPKPGPDRQFDWEATLADYDGAEDSKTRSQIGRAATKVKAVMDLYDQLEDAQAEKIAPARGFTLGAVIGLASWLGLAFAAWAVLA